MFDQGYLVVAPKLPWGGAKGKAGYLLVLVMDTLSMPDNLVKLSLPKDHESLTLLFNSRYSPFFYCLLLEHLA